MWRHGRWVACNPYLCTVRLAWLPSRGIALTPVALKTPCTQCLTLWLLPVACCMLQVALGMGATLLALGFIGQVAKRAIADIEAEDANNNS